MKKISTLLAGLLLAAGLASTDSAASAEARAPIQFGAINWESGALTTEILRLIVEHGYGYHRHPPRQHREHGSGAGAQ